MINKNSKNNLKLKITNCQGLKKVSQQWHLQLNEHLLGFTLVVARVENYKSFRVGTGDCRFESLLRPENVRTVSTQVRRFMDS